MFGKSRFGFRGLTDCSGAGTHNHLACRYHLYEAVACIYLSCPLRVLEWSRLYSCLNVKELFVKNRRDVWRLSDCNKIWSHKHLFRNWTLKCLAKMADWVICVVSTYLSSASVLIWLYVFIISNARFRVKSPSMVA